MSTRSAADIGKVTRASSVWPPQPAGRRILLVEASPKLQQPMTAWLKLSGFQVDIAADIHAGWDSIQTNRYDLVITNHNPPYLSGLEFIHRLLAEQVPVPHILLTAKLRLKELNQNYALKFEWFVLVLTTTVLRKPFSTDELLESINMVLAQAAQLPPRTGAARYSIPDSVHAFDRMINELPCEEYFQESRCAEHCATT